MQVVIAAAVGALLGGLVGGGAQLVGAFSGGSDRSLPIGLIACGALACGYSVFALFGRYRLARAAAEVDRRRDLKERFATAVELAKSDRAEAPVARACYTHALAALGGRPLAGLGLWRSMRVWIVVALLAAGFAGAMDALAWQSYEGRLAALSADEREQLAGAFRREAALIGGDEVKQALNDAAAAVIQVDEEALEAILDDLRKHGFIPVELTPEAVRLAAFLAGPDLAAKIQAYREATSESSDGPEFDPAGRWTNVFHPDYRPTEVSDREGSGFVPTASFEEMWPLAQLRAADALASGEIPAEYRPIVRDYFAAE